jgi:hypothetical protein
VSKVIKLDVGNTEVYTFGDGKVTIESDKPLTVAGTLFYLESIKYDLMKRLDIFCEE